MAQDIRSRYLHILMNRLADAKYPSVTMLDRIERSVADRETATEYVHLLLDAVERDRYPSPELLDRVRRLADALGA
jgi:hypothetical protein